MSGPAPPDIERLLKRLATLWAKHPARPRLALAAAKHWDRLIDSWIGDRQLPLLVRKREQGIARGEIVEHSSGRKLILTDNSPASWTYMEAFSGKLPSLSDIRCALKNDTIPFAMVVDRQMKARAQYKCCRGAFQGPNKLGWRVCHKRSVALGGRGPLRSRPIEELHEHFRNFLSPSNIFLVPSVLGGLGEIRHLIEAINREPHGL